jgi:hypothetical protein
MQLYKVFLVSPQTPAKFKYKNYEKYLEILVFTDAWLVVRSPWEEDGVHRNCFQLKVNPISEARPLPRVTC